MTTPYAGRGRLARLACLFVACAAWPLARLRPRRAVTLCYHGVTAAQAPRFRRQMRLVARRPHVRVTFDDAFANLLEHALPAARELGVPVTIFAVSGRLGTRPDWDIDPAHPDARARTMTPDEIVTALAAGGVSLGAHGVTHARLTDLPAAAARAELAWSRAALEQLIDAPVHEFAFPHGAVDDALVQAACDAGYRRVHVLDAAPAGPRDAVVERMSASPDLWPIEFRLTVDGAYAWLPPLRRAVRALRARSRTSPAPRRIDAGDSRPLPFDSDDCAAGVDRSGSDTCAEVAA